MPAELSWNTPNWLSGLRYALRILVLVLSGAVTYFLLHTLEAYRGNSSLDLRKGELPMVWPARTHLAPTIVLFSVAAANFLTSVAILTLSLKSPFRRLYQKRDDYRVIAGGCRIILWTTALAVFTLLDRASNASLGHYACANRDVESNGRFQYRTICSEQSIAFYLAVGVASVEVLSLLVSSSPPSISPKPDQAR
ncbi:uncharacterized protein EI97DRAFT_369213 [Westerdykella ornata]|uniref:MARVEL domain-containing protein n=1 Tax=Westerdykella ornata TaxID=318751 RepID=A0A6A6JV51_WESOR|nr:uncharacterized protein EI97DRAFT_369213 [Westerdykella ornata]KAF2279973.1 hypothetical protein EI97DRAFT_369213 [Westerdykella ornata]